MEEIRNPDAVVSLKKWRIEFNSDYRPTPLSYWVHQQPEGEVWAHADRYEPGLPHAVAGKGYPLLIVETRWGTLRFASAAEIVHFLEVIGQRHLPTTRQLSRLRGRDAGPNSHWLSRLPGRIKSWKARENLMPTLRGGLKAFEALYETKQS